MVQARSAVTRARLAKVAREHFQARSYAQASLREIARAAGKSQSSIFRYWPDKASMWREVMGCEPPIDGIDAVAMGVLLAAQDQTRAGLNMVLCELHAGRPIGVFEAQLRALIDLQTLAAAKARPNGYESVSQPQRSDLEMASTDGSPEEDDPTHNDQRAISPIEARLGARIRELRIKEGLTLVTLGHRLSMSFGHLGKYELGRSRVPATMIPKIAQALNCSVVDLLGGLYDEANSAP